MEKSSKRKELRRKSDRFLLDIDLGTLFLFAAAVALFFLNHQGGFGRLHPLQACFEFFYYMCYIVLIFRTIYCAIDFFKFRGVIYAYKNIITLYDVAHESDEIGDVINYNVLSEKWKNKYAEVLELVKRYAAGFVVSGVGIGLALLGCHYLSQFNYQSTLSAVFGFMLFFLIVGIKEVFISDQALEDNEIREMIMKHRDEARVAFSQSYNDIVFSKGM